MQAPTVPPWLSWSSGLVLRQRYQPRRRSRLTIYTYGHDDSHILRIGAWPPHNTPRPAPAGWERYPIDREPWHLAMPPPDSAHLYPERINVEWMEPTAAPAARGWSHALRAWMTGTALLALLVLLARAAEKCIEKKLFKRRRSQEWPAPNVRATSRSDTDSGTVMIPGLELAAPLPANLDVDLPPPYSACGGSSHKTTPDILHEEPPPPYSDCFVEFSNKNGIPSVLIFSRRRSPLVDRREIDGTRTHEAIENEHNENSDETNTTGVDDDAKLNDEIVNSENLQRSVEPTANADEDDNLKDVIIV